MPTPEHHTDNATKKLHRFAQPIGNFLTETFHMIGLFAIGAATVWAGVVFFIELMGKGHASIEDK